MRSWFKSGLALAIIGAFMTASVVPASADYWHWRHGYYCCGGGAVAAGVAAGIIGGAIVGSAIANSHPPAYYEGANCHPGPLECHNFAPPCFHNEYGEYICPPPARRCYHRAICY